MLDIWDDNLDYGKILQPPDGFQLKRAIGTTYSVDPSCLLLIPVAMFYSRPMESQLINEVNRFDLFDAINRASKVITLFHQKNKISIPKRVSKLLHYTEGCLAGINQETQFSSFHPKCWFLIFEDLKTKQRKSRYIITSRNLTFDQSWDIVFQMEGDVSEKAIEKNQPFIDFLNFLENKSGKTIESWVKNDIKKTKFRVELPFTDWRFCPIGIGEGFIHPFRKRSFKSEQLLMMSPFLDDKMVKDISLKATKKRWLFARKDELEKLDKGTFSEIKPTEYFCINERILSGAIDERVPEDSADSPPSNYDLHAKLFINRVANSATWYVGSANLSAAAFDRNTECLMELKSNDRSAFPETIKKLLVTNDIQNNLFEQLDPSQFIQPEPDDQLKQQLRKLEFDLASCKISGKCNPNAAGVDLYQYDIAIDTSNINWPPDFSIYVKPLFLHKSPDPGYKIAPGVLASVNFPESFTLSQLSRFLIISISHTKEENIKKQFLLLSDIEVPESRLARVFSEVIDSSDKFLKYLMTLLNDNGLIESSIPQQCVDTPLMNISKDLKPALNFYEVPLYEQLLQAASRNPSKLRSVEEAISRIKEDTEKQGIVPDEFMEMWKIFKSFVKNEK